MKILCKLFGHVPEYGYGRSKGHGYFRISGTQTDGVGRIHAALTTECERCGKRYQVGMLHLPTEEVTK